MTPTNQPDLEAATDKAEKLYAPLDTAPQPGPEVCDECVHADYDPIVKRCTAVVRDAGGSLVYCNHRCVPPAPEPRWKCACGWYGTPSQMTVSNTLRTCPQCGASGGLIIDDAPVVAPQPAGDEPPDSPSGALWRTWFDHVGDQATPDVINATATLVIGEREIAARNDKRRWSLESSLSVCHDAAIYVEGSEGPRCSECDLPCRVRTPSDDPQEEK